MRFLLPSLLTLIACGDKDPPDSADTAADTEPTTETAETGDTAPACALPTVSASYALPWAASTPYGGYSAAATPGRALITDPLSGIVYGIPWGSAGVIEVVADLQVEGMPYSPDRLWSLGEWTYIADSARVDWRTGEMTGGGFLMNTPYLDTLTGVVLAEHVYDYTLTGAHADGYAGALAVYDADGDGLDDLVAATGPIPAELVVFTDLSTHASELLWNDAALSLEICPAADRVIYGPVDAARFGDGYLAVGCPGSGYRGGEVRVLPDPIGSGSDPLFTVSGVAGWYVHGEPGGAVYADARGDTGMTTIWGDGTSEGIALADGASGSWWGASPVTWTVGECSYLAVGEPTALTKGDETGAVWVAVLGDDGRPGEWATLDLPSAGEGYDLRWIGSVIVVSPDGAHLFATGWQKGGGAGGGAASFDLVY